MRRKGFTLIELIVVMSIIAILILLAAPKYKEYTNEARLTRIKVNIKELENASFTYYMKNNDWPRLSDEELSADELNEYAIDIYNYTGKEVNLDKDGKYYSIHYDALKNYIKEPKGSIQYILQNPVGTVYYLDGLTAEGKTVLENISIGETNAKPVAVISMYPLTNLTTLSNINWGYESSTDADNDDIIAAEWQLDEGIITSIPLSTISADGTHIMKLRVKDSMGNWSSWVEKEFYVEKDFKTIKSLLNMNGYLLPEGTTFKVSSSYTDRGSHQTKVSDNTSIGWVANTFNGWIECRFPDGVLINIKKVQIMTPSTPAGKFTYSIYGLNQENWVNIGGDSNIPLSYGNNTLPQINVTEGVYSGIKIVVSNTASWTGVNEVTIE